MYFAFFIFAFFIKMKRFLFQTILIGSICQHINVYAQGINTNFGQNRVQFGRFDWNYLRSENFDAYYYSGGKEIATFCAKNSEEQVKNLEEIIDHRLSGRIEVICYNTLSDYKQSNFGMEDLAQNTGGYTQVNSNKVFVYFNGDHADLLRQLKEGISLVLLNEVLYGGNLQERLQNAALLNIPQWYLRGLTSYLSKQWDSEMDNRMKDGILSKKFKKFNRLNQKDAVFAGHSLWKYMVETSENTSPSEVISQMIYITRMTRNYEMAVEIMMNKRFRIVLKEWFEYYNNLYTKEDVDRKLPFVELKIKRRIAQYIEPQMKAGPKGNYVLFTTNKNGKYKVWLFDTKKGKTKKVLKGGLKYYQLEIDHSFPLVAWDAGGDKFGMVYEKGGKILLKTIDLVNKKKDLIEFVKFDKITGIDFSDNGRTIVVSAIRKGQSDIYTFDILSRKEKQLTNDFYDDRDPRYVQGSSQIAFSSNRLTDSLALGVVKNINEENNFDIYLYDLESTPNSRMLKRITKSPYINETNPIEYSRQYFAYLSDYNGIKNRYVSRVEEEYDFTEIRISYFNYSEKSTDTLRYANKSPFIGNQFIYHGKLISLDSTVEKIDTIEHTKDIIYSYPLTNFKRNILAQDISLQSKTIFDLVQFNNKFYIMQSPLTKNVAEESKLIESNPNMFRLKSGVTNKPFVSGAKIFRSFASSLDSIAIAVEPDDVKEIRIPQDTNAYFFISEFTPRNYKRPSYIIVPKLSTLSFNKSQVKLSSPKFYDVTFFADEVVTQIDNSIINTYYQPISSAAQQMFNPGLNGMMKLGMIDMMEDYRFTGGVRLSFDLSGFDYFASFETLKKRFDHKFIYYRQNRTGGSAESNNSVRSLSQELRYVLKFPFNPASSLRLNIFGRQDRDIYRSSNNPTLETPDKNTNWIGAKLEYVFDNTVPKGLNLWNGTRLKLFYERYYNFENTDVQLNVVGFDIRHYEKIHRQIVWSSRITANTSFGPAKVVYYLGGVENWIPPRFSSENSALSDQNYVFQALACNLRGFEQNIRNGNTFALGNTEIRIPIFQYAFNRPLKSEFLNTFQLVPFFDIGSAWIGNNPYSDENTFNQKIIEVGPVKAKVINVRDPIVAGFGGGLRTKLIGYFMRFDAAWGIQDGEINDKPVYYFAIGLDF